MTDFDWKLMKARKRMARRKEGAVLQRIKGALIGISLVAVAAISMGAADGEYRLVEETYTVQSGDTLWGIGEAFIAKNTYGRRHLLEFIEGIKQENEELVQSHGQVHPGQKLKITYWVAGDE